MSSAQQLVQWRDAVATIATVFPERAHEIIFKAMKSGLITATAKTLSFRGGHDTNLVVPRSFWLLDLHEEPDWDLGVFRMEEPISINGSAVYTAAGIQFNAAEVAGLIKARPTSTSNQGRIPLEFWDDLWVEMCRQIYLGEMLAPKKQSDIQTAMFKWLEKHDQHPGESTIKARAKKLYKMFKSAEEK